MENILPGIYLFNPTCEYAVANGNASWQANRILQKMESDLSLLPAYLSQQNDFILTNKPPSHKFKDSLQQISIDMPGFACIDNTSINEEIINKPIGKILPWGWSPAAHKKLSVLKESCSTEFKNSPVYNWQPEHRSLYSKKFARVILKSILLNYPSEYFISSDQIAQVCTEKHEFETLLKKWGELMVKAPWSSSGRGLQPIRKKPVHPKVWDKLMGIVKEQGYAIVEPFLNKILDLGFQFKLYKGKVSFLGISNFSTDHKGQYIGNSLNGLPNNLDVDIVEFAGFITEKIVHPLIHCIETSDLAKYYEGHLGVDTLIFRDINKKLRINPCLEINVRQSMGMLSLQFEKLIHPEKKGMFRTYYKPGSNFLHYANEMEIQHPLKITNNKIESGFFPLVEALENTLFGAYILV